MAKGIDSTLWIVNDSGNKDILYQVNMEGEIVHTLKVKNASNEDWEDLCRDKEGNLYISDLGNNNNARKDLVIYKTSNPDIEKGDKIDAEKIEIKFPDQKKFPPKKKNLKFDSEAIFHAGDRLFIITKNRAKPFSADATVYSVPDEPGNYTATFISNITTCEDPSSCQITAADISPDEKSVVLLGYGRMWVYTNVDFSDFSFEKKEMIDLEVSTQLESITFLDNSTLLISDEQNKKGGRNLYLYKL